MMIARLFALALACAFLNPATASTGHEFSDEQKCKMISVVSMDLQELGFLLLKRLHLMIGDEKYEKQPFAHPPKDYLSLLNTLEELGKLRHELKEQYERECEESSWFKKWFR